MEDLYVVYSGEVFAFALASLHNRHEAQDVAQQIFVRVLASIGTYSPRAGIPFRAWLFRIARNEVLNTRRGVTRRRELPESPVAMQMRRELQRQDDPGALSALSWIRDADLQALVDRLPASQREVLLLRHGFDLTMDQIATITARSPAAVSELHRRALAYLKERLEAVEGRRSRRRRREPMRVRFKPARVIVSRRFALGPVRRPMRLY
jgi:RNA polymerase sigma-70 factor (ECF subfamily)